MITRKLVPDFVYDKKSAAVETHPTLHRDRSFGVSEFRSSRLKPPISTEFPPAGETGVVGEACFDFDKFSPGRFFILLQVKERSCCSVGLVVHEFVLYGGFVLFAIFGPLFSMLSPQE